MEDNDTRMRKCNNLLPVARKRASQINFKLLCMRSELEVGAREHPGEWCRLFCFCVFICANTYNMMNGAASSRVSGLLSVLARPAALHTAWLWGPAGQK